MKRITTEAGEGVGEGVVMSCTEVEEREGTGDSGELDGGKLGKTGGREKDMGAGNIEEGERCYWNKGRLGIIFWIFAAAAALIILRICYIAIDTKNLRRQLLVKSEFIGEIRVPGCRGRIVTQSGKVLAQSHSVLNMEWNVPLDIVLAEENWYYLQQAGGDWLRLPVYEELEGLLGKTVNVSGNLEIHSDQILENVLELYPLLRPRIRYKRVLSAEGERLSCIGVTKVNENDGIERGVSGIELLYDKTLRAGSYCCRYLPSRRIVIMKTDGCDGQDLVVPDVMDALEKMTETAANDSAAVQKDSSAKVKKDSVGGSPDERNDE